MKKIIITTFLALSVVAGMGQTCKSVFITRDSALTITAIYTVPKETFLFPFTPIDTTILMWTENNLIGRLFMVRCQGGYTLLYGNDGTPISNEWRSDESNLNWQSLYARIPIKTLSTGSIGMREFEALVALKIPEPDTIKSEDTTWIIDTGGEGIDTGGGRFSELVELTLEKWKILNFAEWVGAHFQYMPNRHGRKGPYWIRLMSPGDQHHTTEGLYRLWLKKKTRR